MKEHMEVPLDISNMSEQELQFHYFKVSFCYFSSSIFDREFAMYPVRYACVFRYFK